ncbi:hypothetical protein EX30DRAFT_374627 [Ascodesmis nigricans]|uniref:Uncharacterized protein n=1 Tax=Ascodesmis nigricans TaxID=341454 RepID=A0A4S2MR95_9PEZI|nr:hypothetical protein EX30DRAFT_374627 [Ascodesmis nigricans]
MQRDTKFPETQWWKIITKVTADGRIYQEVANYRSGHVVNINVSTVGMAPVKGQRLGLVTESGWVFSASPANLSSFLIENFVDSNKILWGSRVAELVGDGDDVRSRCRWTLTKVSLSIQSGKRYFIINMATNSPLSTNGNPTSNTPLILSQSSTTADAQHWLPESDLQDEEYFTFYALSSDTNEKRGVLSVPSPDSDYVPDGHVGFTFPVLSDNSSVAINSNSTRWRLVRADLDIEGYALVNPLGQAIGLQEVGHHNFAVTLAPESQSMANSDPTMLFRWRFIEVDAAPPPTSIVRTEKYLPDGMYRIFARQKRLALSMNPKNVIGRRAQGLQYPLRVELTQSLSEENYYDLWYIQRQHHAKLASDEPEVYTIRSCAGPLFLAVGDRAARQKYEGVPLVGSPSLLVPEVIEWRISKNSALGWVVESRYTGGVLDVSEKNITTNPLLVQSPEPTKIWHMDPVTPALSSGAFVVMSLFANTTIAVSSTASTDKKDIRMVSGPPASFATVQRHWRFTCQPDGLYHIESLQHLQFLTQTFSGLRQCHLTNAVEGEGSKWQLWPDIHGSYRVQNFGTGDFWTLNHGSAADGEIITMAPPVGEHDLPWQRFRFTRVDSTDRSWDDLPTDKIVPAVYQLRNRRTKGYLCFSSSTPQLQQPAVCTPLHVEMNDVQTSSSMWNIKASGAGYYALHNTAGYSLGQRWSTGDVVALHGFFNSTRWKLLCFDGLDYRIVNKDTGQVLTAYSTDETVTATADLGPVLTQRWELVKYSSAPEDSGTDFMLLTREVPYPNGLYHLSCVGSGKLLVATSNGVLAVEDVITQPFSPNVATQTWILASADDGSGWFTLRSFVFGHFLSLGDDRSVTLQLRPNDASYLGKQFHWKFVQDVVGSNIALVNRTNLPSNLGLQGGPLTPRMYQRTNEDINQRWQLIPRTGKASDVAIAVGVYVIGVYTPPGLSSTSERTAMIIQARSQRQKVLAIAPEATQRIADALSQKAPDRLVEIDDEIVDIDVKADDGLADGGVVSNMIHVSTSLVSMLKSATLTVYDGSKTMEHDRDTEIARRTVSTDQAAERMADAIAEWTKTLPESSTRDATQVVARVIETVSTTRLLDVEMGNQPSPRPNTTGSETDVAAPKPFIHSIAKEVLQSAVVDMAKAMLRRYQSSITSLPVLSRTGPSSPTGEDKPATTTALVLTRGGDSAVILAEHIQQSEDRLWKLDSVETPSGTRYRISHLTSGSVIAYRPGESGVVLVSPSGAGLQTDWKLSTSSIGGTVIVTNEEAPRILTVSDNTLKLEPYDSSHQRSAKTWLLSRSGVYIQNQQAGFTNHVLTALSGGFARCLPYQPFTTLGGPDPAQIWHFIKDSNDGPGTARLVNEATRGTLYRTDDDHTVAGSSLSRSDADTWVLAKNGEHIWFKNEYKGQRKWMMKMGDMVVVGDPGKKEDYKGWKFVSVMVTEREFMTLARCALLGKPGDDATMVYEAQQGSVARWVNYEQDNSYQRYRVLKFGNLSAFMNEATLRILDASGNSVKLDAVTERCWFVVSEDRKQITSMALNTSPPPFQEVVTITGDLPVKTIPFRIQIGRGIGELPFVLGAQTAREVMAVPYDPYDKGQLWYQLEWEKGRFIIHASTRELLSWRSVNGEPQLYLASPPYTSQCLWRLDHSTSSNPMKNGFFPLWGMGALTFTLDDPAPNIDPLSPRPIRFRLLSPTLYGVRFISSSTSYTLTWRSIVLKTFLQSHAPVFLHLPSTPLPTNIPYHHSVANSTPGPKVYIIVRQSSEPIYLNYTDITYCLFYPLSSASSHARSGWRYITTRYNNTTHLLECVYFPSTPASIADPLGLGGWVYNIDLTFSATATVDDNPLKILKRTKPRTATKLHVFVDENLVIRPVFPTIISGGLPAEWASPWAVDAGNNEVMEVVEARMVVDDGSRWGGEREWWRR